MSEFTYACPVCGQHIKCDSSQAGKQMECPTCFQKVIVPQAPTTHDSKFILTGTKVGDRPVPIISDITPVSSAPSKGFPIGMLVLLLLICAAGVAAFVFRGKIIKFETKEINQAAKVVGEEPTLPTNQIVLQPPKPALIAPPANDTNWMLDLTGVTIPDARAAGRIHGQGFIVERAILQNGTLTLREGRSGPIALGVQINFGGAEPDALAGQALNIATNAVMAARVMMFWQDDGETARESIEGGYALRLDFGQVSSNRLSGQIYFCAPDDEKSYIAGNFNAEIHKSRPRRRN